MIKIIPKKLKGTVHVVSSKSLSHRYIMAGSLAHGISTIENALDSDDIVATKAALSVLGAKIVGNKITGSKIKKMGDVIDANESGSTLRFLIPLAMLQGEKIRFEGRGMLPVRPLNVYKDIFAKNYHYKYLSKLELPLEVAGPLKGGDFHLPGDISSQFITGLLYTLPLLKEDSRIILTTELESKGYVDLTLDVLSKFGIKVEYENNIFSIKGNQKYIPGNYSVEGDYSAAAFFVVAGLIGDKLLLTGLNENSLQGDKAIIDFAIKMGGDIKFKKEGLLITPSETNGITIDVGQTPDLGPILMVLGALSEGVTTITNAARLRIKESDRLEAMIENLTKMGVKLEEDGDTVRVYGQKTLKGGVTLSTFGDHRIAMACAVAAIRADGPVYLDDEKVVSKSYPKFFEVYKKLGGEVIWKP